VKVVLGASGTAEQIHQASCMDKVHCCLCTEHMYLHPWGGVLCIRYLQHQIHTDADDQRQVRFRRHELHGVYHGHEQLRQLGQLSYSHFLLKKLRLLLG
jgi:hypothetical protein